MSASLASPSTKWREVDQGTGPVPRARHGHRAVATRDMILVIGGGSEAIFDDMYVFRTTTHQWYSPPVKGHIPPGRAAYGLTTDGTRVFLFGGMLEHGTYNNDLFEMKLGTWEWKRVQPRPSKVAPPRPRLGHTLTMIGTKLFLFGGLANDGDDSIKIVPRYLNDMYTIDVKNSANCIWDMPTITGPVPSPRESHSAVAFTPKIGNPKLLIYGGMNGIRLGDVWILDINSMCWSKPDITGTPPQARSLHTASVINQKMFVFGGWVQNDSENTDLTDQIVQDEWKVTNSLSVLNLNSMSWEPESVPSHNNDHIPCARAGHSAVVVNSRLYIWSGRDGSRNLSKGNLCCSDLWYLETEKPVVCPNVQLTKATSNSLEINWDSVPNADIYLVQVQKIHNPPVLSLPIQKPLNRIKTANISTSKSSISKSPVKKIITIPKQQIVSSFSNSPISSSQIPPGVVTSSVPSIIRPPLNSSIRILTPQMVQSSTGNNVQAVKLTTTPGGHQSSIRFIATQVGGAKQFLVKNATSNPTINQQFKVVPKVTSNLTFANPKNGPPQMVKMVASNHVIKSSGANIITVTSAVTIPSSGFSAVTTMSSNQSGSITAPSIESSSKSTMSPTVASGQTKVVNTAQGMRMFVVNSASTTLRTPVSTTSSPQQVSVRWPPTTGFPPGQKFTLPPGAIKATQGPRGLILANGQQLRIVSAPSGGVGPPRYVLLPPVSAGQTITSIASSTNTVNSVNSQSTSQDLSKQSTTSERIPQSDGPMDDVMESDFNDSPGIKSGILESATLPLLKASFTELPSLSQQSLNDTALVKLTSQTTSVYSQVSRSISSSSASSSCNIANSERWYDVGLVKHHHCIINSYFKPLNELEFDSDRDFDSNSPPVYGEEAFCKHDLDMNCAYRIRVCAINALGRGNWSQVLAYRTNRSGFPSAPSNIKVSKVIDGVQLTWTTPAAEKIVEYSVYLEVKPTYKKVFCGAQSQCTVPMDTITLAATDKKSGITFRIAARNQQGYGPTSQIKWLYDIFATPKRPSFAKTDLTPQKKPKTN